MGYMENAFLTLSLCLMQLNAVKLAYTIPSLETGESHTNKILGLA